MLGRNTEARAKAEPSVLLAEQTLASQIPNLSGALLEGHPHIGYSGLGLAEGYIKNKEFFVRDKKLPDGSLVQPTRKARKSIIKKLHKAGIADIPLQQALSIFDQAPENKKVEIAPGLEIIKWEVQKLKIDLTKAQFMDSLIPVKIAYEFLACHGGTAIYEDIPQLRHCRACLRTNSFESDDIQVERLSSGKYDAFHGIVFEGNDPHARVQIRLFDELAFRVHFLRLSISGPRFVYTHRLDASEEQIDIVQEPYRGRT